eukprot:567799-Prymnesium_polylepis.1
MHLAALTPLLALVGWLDTVADCSVRFESLESQSGRIVDRPKLAVQREPQRREVPMDRQLAVVWHALRLEPPID